MSGVSFNLFGDEEDDHDPGGRVVFPLMGGVKGGATFVGARKLFRPVLWRQWGPLGAPYVAWIGMNPSMGDPKFDDPTLRREQDFTRQFGFTSYRKLNISDYRATHPKTFDDESVPVESAENERYIKSVCRDAALVIACWGKPPLRLRTLAHRTTRMLSDFPEKVRCLGFTKDGYPRHPLYVKGATAELVEYRIKEGGW